MAEWDNSAEELTLVFPVEKAYWNTLNKTQQQVLVKDLATEQASHYGEVSKLKGYTTTGAVQPPDEDHLIIHSILWVIPNKEQRAVLDGT